MNFRLLITSAMFLTFASCSKDGIMTTNCESCTEMEIIVGLEHHGQPIKDGKVYIKKDATDKPGTYDYSAVVEMTEDGPVAIFPHKLPGRYYIYADGYDPAIGKDVSGGIPVTINNDYLYTHYSTVVPVTETGH